MKISRSQALRIAISAGLLFALFRFGGVNVSDIADVIRTAKPIPFLGAFVVYCIISTWVRGLRWQALIRDLGFPVTLARCNQIFLIGTTFNQVLPTGIGGDVVRSVILGRDGMGPARAASTVLVERAAGMVALLALGFAVVGVAGQGFPPSLRFALLAACALGALGGWLLRQGEVFRSRSTGVPLLGRVASHPGVARFVASFKEYSARGLGKAFVLSVVFGLLLVLTNRLLGLALGAPEVTLTQWALVVPLIALSLLVPSIAGLGVREWTYVGILGALPLAHVSAASATAISLAFHGLNLLLALAGGVLLATGRGGESVMPTGDDSLGAT